MPKITLPVKHTQYSAGICIRRGRINNKAIANIKNNLTFVSAIMSANMKKNRTIKLRIDP